MNIICFHNPNEENGYLSNWYPTHFTIDGIEFSSMEQFMMYQKACRFHDASVAKEILSTNDVAEILENLKILQDVMIKTKTFCIG